MAEGKKKKNLLVRFFSRLGPGFITGAADDDTSGVVTYSQAGAQFGFGQLWTAFFTFPFMAVIQEMCGRIGLVTGRGLAAIIRKHYSKIVLYFAVFLLVLANTVNIGADLGAMAATSQMLLNIPFIVWLAIMTIGSLLLQILVPYKIYAKILKWFGLTLLAYMVTAFLVNKDWGATMLAAITPHFSFDAGFLLNIVAVLGTTISPYLFFWQASEEVEEEIYQGELCSMGAGTPRFTKAEFKGARLDTYIGMFFSQAMMFFIIVTTGATLGAHGITNIQTAQDAAQALRPLAGDFAYALFALGAIGIGLLGVPVLAGSASYAVSETLGWKEGLYRKFSQARGFYLIIAAAMIVGALINFLPIPPFKLLYYAAALNGLCAPPLLILIMLIANNKKIMGKYTNGKVFNILGWTITVLMGFCGIALIISMLQGKF